MPVQSPEKLEEGFLFKTMVDRSVDGVLVIDTAGVIQYANPAAVTMFSGKTSDLVGFQIGYPSGSEFVEMILPESRKSRHVELRASEITWKGQTASLANIRDVTDRVLTQKALKESENRFRHAIEQAPFPIMIHAENGEVLSINKMWTELTGYTTADIPTIESWTSLAYGDRADQVHTGVIETLFDQQGKTDEGEFSIRCKDGSDLIWTFNSASLGSLPDGRKVIESMAADITRRREAEMGMQERIKELNCIYDISSAAHHCTDIEALLETTVGLIPKGWQHPENTCARIRMDGQSFVSTPFRESAWQLTSDITINEKRRGVVEVYCDKTLPPHAEDPFWDEERDLIQAIGRTLSDACKRMEAAARMAHINQTLHAILEVNHLIVREKSLPDLLQQACDLLVKSRSLEVSWIIFAPEQRDQPLVSCGGISDAAAAAMAQIIRNRQLPHCCRQVSETYGAVSFHHREGACASCPVSDLLPLSDRWIVPLSHADTVYGFLGVYAPEGFDIDGEEKDLLKQIADDISFALHAILTTEELNRRTFLLEEAEKLANTGAWEWDIGKHRMYVSDQWKRIHGAPTSSLTAEDLATIAHPDDWERIRTALEKTRKEGIPYQIEHRILRKNDGTERIINAYGRVVQDANGLPKTVFGAATDVTEIRAEEHRKNELEIQLQQAQKLESIGRLAGGVAHDFNNMLNIVLGYSEIVMENLDAEDPNREHLNEIFSAGERARNLTRQLLAFSRKQTLEMLPLDLNQVIRDFEKMLRRTVTEDVHIETRLNPALGAVEADMGQMEQVIMNLVVNAHDAMPEGGVLTIETAEVALDEASASHHKGVMPGNYAMLAVSDTGHGMDEETAKMVFEPFFTTKAEGKGTGLGLSTVYGIVKQHRGNIWVNSEPGVGTTFKVYFPLLGGEVDPSAAPVTEEGAIDGTETILVVEDMDDVRRLAVKILESRGYTLLQASSGKQAIKVSQEAIDGFDLLLTDVVMPGMSGKQLADRLTADQPGLKVIFMSGYTDEETVQRGVLRKGVSFIQKPFGVLQLAKAVRNILDSSDRPLESREEMSSP